MDTAAHTLDPNALARLVVDALERTAAPEGEFDRDRYGLGAGEAELQLEPASLLRDGHDRLQAADIAAGADGAAPAIRNRN